MCDTLENPNCSMAINVEIDQNLQLLISDGDVSIWVERFSGGMTPSPPKKKEVGKQDIEP